VERSGCRPSRAWLLEQPWEFEKEEAGETTKEMQEIMSNRLKQAVMWTYAHPSIKRINGTLFIESVGLLIGLIGIPRDDSHPPKQLPITVPRDVVASHASPLGYLPDSTRVA